MGYKGNSSKLDRHVNFKEADASLVAMFNSYKDGSVEVDIVYLDKANGEIRLNAEIDNVKDRRSILSLIHDPMKKILNGYAYPDSVNMLSLEDDIYRSLKYASNLKGAMTVDYNIHECHSKIVLGNFPKLNKQQNTGVFKC